jgi:hypothetical protein
VGFSNESQNSNTNPIILQYPHVFHSIIIFYSYEVAAIDEEVGRLITWYVGLGKYMPCWQVGRVEGV